MIRLEVEVMEKDQYDRLSVDKAGNKEQYDWVQSGAWTSTETRNNMTGANPWRQQG